MDPIENENRAPLDDLGDHLMAWINVLVCAGGLVPYQRCAHVRTRDAVDSEGKSSLPNLRSGS